MTTRRLALMLAAATAAAACGPSIDVSTAVAPEAASLGVRRTFTIVETPATLPVVADNGNGNGNGHANGNGHVRDTESDMTGYGVKDPMIDNSITSKAVAELIRAELEARGFHYVTENPDFVIRFNATIAPILEIRSYDTGGYYGHSYYGYHGYGYGYGWDGGCCGGYSHSTASYDRKTVIIDAVDPATDKLLWRGQGTSDSYYSARKFMKDFRAAVHEIVEEFPVQRAPMLVTR